ncbi:MAG: RHS repeat-associated core domain-containing protein, partial [Anaerolineales bacterium]
GVALSALPDNSAGNLDYGWLGSHLRPLEHAPGLATIELGARPYVPGIGRFLSVDPIEGGSANDYDYVNGDPVNNLDLTGLASEKALNGAEEEALGRKAAGESYDRKAYNSARQKQKYNEKVRGERNKQKRQSNFSATPTTRGAYLAQQESARAAGRSPNYGRAAGAAGFGGFLIGVWWGAKWLSPACGPAAPVCAIAL